LENKFSTKIIQPQPKHTAWNLIPALCMLVLSALFFSCSAPHNNPLDPENPQNKLCTLEGIIRTDTHTQLPLEEVAVYWKSENAYTRTNASGKFSLKNIQPVNGWLYFEKSGFYSDSVFIRWQSQKIISVSQNLNAQPRLLNASLYSVVKNKYSQTEYFLVAEIGVSDDDDIDSVFLVNSELQINKSLEKITATYFEGEFSDFELQLVSLVETIGRDFSLIVKEKNRGKQFVGSATVKRVIEQEIETLGPKNQDSIVTLQPQLRWKRFTPGFRFSYFLEIYTDETEPKLKWSKEKISSDSIDIIVDPPIIPTPTVDEYFWVIWCIDEFGNRSRSKPASFLIIQQQQQEKNFHEH
jgi:hypothetical protein